MKTWKTISTALAPWLAARSVVRALALLAATLAATVLPAQAPQRAVLVTGASSGIGRKIAERLAREGFLVYAGARKAEDIAELSKIPNMKGIRLDVTSAPDIEAAVASITGAGRGLYGVVNNAGIAAGGALIMTEERELRRSMACALALIAVTIVAMMRARLSPMWLVGLGAAVGAFGGV